ncbi:dihydrodipicolinate reductase C-terminal domain-containing protein [Candidatus Vidania fulgoroideorum]
MNIFLSGKGKIGKYLKKDLKKYNVVSCGKNDFKKKKKKIKNSDIIIDFSNKKRTFEILKECLKKKKKLIIGTTGFNKKEIIKIKKYSKKIPIFFEYNINKNFYYFTKILKKSSKYFKNFNFHLIEIHRKKKKDIPSGTYFNICKEIKKKIPYSSIRICNEKGKHKILIYNKNEKIEISHEIKNRKCLSENIIKICKYIKKKSKGMYNIKNI